jgi:hypothetical protein
MDKKTITLSFSIQALILFSFLWNYFLGSKADGWIDLILIIQLMITALAIILSAITLAILRKKNLVWWHGILISIGSVLLSLGIIVLFARI